MNFLFDCDKEEYKSMANDLIKFTIILIILNFLMFLSDTTNNRFLGERYIGIILFVIAGLITYWLLIYPYLRFD